MVSTAQKLLIDVAVSHALKLQRLEAYIARMDSLVDRRHRCTWRVMLDAAKLASRLESVLETLGIERRAKPLDLMSQIQALHQNGDAAGSRPDAATATQPDEVAPGRLTATSSSPCWRLLSLDRSNCIAGKRDVFGTVVTGPMRGFAIGSMPSRCRTARASRSAPRSSGCGA
jgi:hypothetical protein